MSLTTITLHDRLGRLTGRETWKLSVNSVAEALRAIELQSHRFFDAIHRLQEGGVGFCVLINGEDTPDDEYLVMRSKDIRTIDIIPAIEGSSRNARIIIGIVLIVAASIMTGGFAAAGSGSWLGAGSTATGTTVAGTTAATGIISAGAGQAMVMAGASLLIGGIAEMFMPSVENNSKSGDKEESYTYSGAFNRAGAGGPVRVLYGCMHVGSQVVNGGVNISEGKIPSSTSVAYKTPVFNPTLQAFENARNEGLSDIYPEINGEGFALPGHVATPGIDLIRPAAGNDWSLEVRNVTDDVTITYSHSAYTTIETDSNGNTSYSYELGAEEGSGTLTSGVPITIDFEATGGLPQQLTVLCAAPDLVSVVKRLPVASEVAYTLDLTQPIDENFDEPGGQYRDTGPGSWQVSLTNVDIGSVIIEYAEMLEGTYASPVDRTDHKSYAINRQSIDQTYFTTSDIDISEGVTRIEWVIRSREGFFDPIRFNRMIQSPNQ